MPGKKQKGGRMRERRGILYEKNKAKEVVKHVINHTRTNK
jgi:hypothetical protein